MDQKSLELGLDVDYRTTRKWKKFANRIKKDRGGICEQCGSTERIEAHHLTYENFGSEDAGDIMILCRICHRELHYGKNLYDVVKGFEAYKLAIEDVFNIPVSDCGSWFELGLTFGKYMHCSYLFRDSKDSRKYLKELVSIREF